MHRTATQWMENGSGEADRVCVAPATASAPSSVQQECRSLRLHLLLMLS